MDLVFILMMMVFVLLLVMSVFSGFLFSNQARAAPIGATSSQTSNECKTTSECRERGNGICLSINGGSNFCGCIDDTDCGSFDCVDNRCLS
ncbi:MAG: hypothetical protein V1818_03760 [Candidatus Aenigmatarchaeota archaeon]